jgi:hypothetical protein
MGRTVARGTARREELTASFPTGPSSLLRFFLEKYVVIYRLKNDFVHQKS